MEQMQIHTRIEPGQFSRALGAGGLHAPVLSSCRYWISRAAVLGEECGLWAQAAFDARGAQSLRSIIGLMRTHQTPLGKCAQLRLCQGAQSRVPTASKICGG
jgi:hypothetical protein